MQQEFNIVIVEWKLTEITDPDLVPANRLYQVYGDSILYGRNQMLYIGRTNNLGRRTDEHVKSDFNRILNLKIVEGCISGEVVDESKLLATIEQILICYVKPSYNSTNIKNVFIKPDQLAILIQNRGDRGMLPLECSNIWWHDQIK